MFLSIFSDIRGYDTSVLSGDQVRMIGLDGVPPTSSPYGLASCSIIILATMKTMPKTTSHIASNMSSKILIVHKVCSCASCVFFMKCKIMVLSRQEVSKILKKIVACT